MPENVQPPQITEVDLDQGKLVLSNHKISEGYALTYALRTFNQMENYRSLNHDQRWRALNALYLGVVPAKVWDGTNIPRANLSRKIIFEQVESTLPAVCQAIFGQPEWFQVEPESNVPMEQARYVRDAMSYYLDHSRNNLSSTAQNEISLAVKSMLLFGNGGVGIEWDSLQKRPNIFWVDINDIYIDPGLTTSNVDEGRGIVWRRFMTVDELAALREDPRMNIPSNDILYYLANTTVNTVGDQTKSVQEAERGVNYQPNVSDWMPGPQDRKVEVLCYYDRNRIIWILGRQWVAYNQKNAYEFIPFCFAPFTPMLGRFYATSLAEVNEDNQRYIQALLNLHLDELTLALQPPRRMPRNARMTPQQMRWKPGAIYQVDSKDDVDVLTPAGATQNVFTEIAYMEQAAEKTTGVNSMMAGAAPRPSNANRTATGVGSQMQGASVRLSQIVSNIETYMLVPLLYKLYRMLQMHVLPWESVPAVSSENDQKYQVSGMVFRSPMQFKMKSASKLVTREQLSQTVPFYLQTLVNGPVMQGLAQVGKTIDWDELSQMIQDATGTAKLYKVVRDLTPEEQQQMQAEQQQQMQAEQQKAMQADQTRLQIASEKNQTAIQTALIAKQPDPPNPAEEEAQRAKVQSEAMLQHIKIQGQRDQMEMKRRESEQKLQLKQMEMQQKAQQVQFQGAIDMEQAQQQAQLDQESMQNQSIMQREQMNMQMAMNKHKQEMAMKKPAAPAAKLDKSKPKPKK